MLECYVSLMLLFSLLIASVGAASTTGIGSSPSPSQSQSHQSQSPSSIKNHCGTGGVVPNSYMVTLKTPTSKDRSAPTSTGLNTNKGDLSYLSGWFKQYEQVNLNKLEAGSNPTRAIHYFIQSQIAVAIEASDDVRQPTARTNPHTLTTQGPCRAHPVLCAISLSHRTTIAYRLPWAWLQTRPSSRLSTTATAISILLSRGVATPRRAMTRRTCTTRWLAG